jgi:hypothetical protein
MASDRLHLFALAKRSIPSAASLEKRTAKEGRMPVVTGRPRERFVPFFAIAVAFAPI